MPKPHIAVIGKIIRKVARLKGGGSALPGLIVEKIDPKFTKDVLAKLPLGVVVISGTNGKTTTTKMVVELLEGQGLKVFTNRTGSNFARGVTAALLADVDIKGELSADIAVLELDEAHAIKFVDMVPPKYSLLLNVMRDQLDRFGEIDKTAQLLQHIAEATTDSVVLNREDQRVANIANHIKITPLYFGLEPQLKNKFKSEDELNHNSSSKIEASVTLESFSDNLATFNIGSSKLTVPLKLKGIYNIFNVAAALALTGAILKENINISKLKDSLSSIKPAFGRGETLTVNEQPLQLVLVKNPSGFRLALQSFSQKDHATMIAINDEYADGRDMSWLWDVDFSDLKDSGVHTISGIRAYDMALRLQYDEVEISKVDTNLKNSLGIFISNNPDKPKLIFCTYTAMLTLRKELSKITDVEEVS
ncbi:DUF1727 domain-containing protein [Candidatus Saccharibacteria bacterium]|jgi:UDP-N-acetylmuramyl tripeptide synthase|nr:DUF1727 domain-containing protein [Candidatus Saccharibacteria bacterium]